MNLKICLQVLGLAICFSGCIYHIFYVNQQYFSYRTTTRVESELQDIIGYPTIVWCASLNEMILPTNENLFDVSGYVDIHNMTIKQLLNLTPPANKVILGCHLREVSNNSHTYEQYSATICYNHFAVKKWISGIDVCYHIFPRHVSNYSIYRVTNAMTHALDVFRIYLSHSFNQAKEVHMIAAYVRLLRYAKDFPVDSRKFPQLFVRRQHENKLILRPFQEFYKFLPPPYDTNCSTDDYCEHSCITNKVITEMNLFPFSQATADQKNLHILSSKHLADPEYLNKWKNIQKQCKHDCPQRPCLIRITSNMVYRYHTPTNEDHIEITVSIPGMYNKEIVSFPVMSFIEFVSSISTCLSIWFGISALTITPKNWLSKEHVCAVPKKYLHWLYCGVCFIAFTYQLSSLGIEYFKYNTISKIEVSFQDEQQYPTLTFCMYQTDINNTILNKRNPPHDYNNLTVKQLFQLTPKEEDVISNCSLRDDFHYGLVPQSQNSCLSFFVVSKAVRGTFVCYSFTPRQLQTYSWTRAATSFRQKGQVYDISLSLNIKPHHIILVTSFIASSVNSVPTLSRNFAQKIIPSLDNTILISLYQYILNALPNPYNTHCIQGHDQDLCNSACLGKQLLTIDRLPYSSFITNSSLKKKIVNLQDIENATLSDFVRNSNDKCRSKCSRVPCFQAISFTDSAMSHYPESATSLRIVSMVPNKPVFSVSSIPATPPLDFLVYLCNCFGIWFGLSIITLNPLPLLQRITGSIRFIAEYSHGVQRIRARSYFSLLKYSVTCACLTGLYWQLWTFGQAYFCYKVSTRIEISQVDVYRLPNINFCTRYREIISTEDNLGLTLRQIFDWTPSPNYSLVGCKFRFNSSEDFKMAGFEECYKIWTIVKYISGGHVCYAFVSDSLASYSLTKVTSSLSNVGIIYKIHLNESFFDSRHILLISDTHPLAVFTNSNALLPIRSRRHLAVLLRHRGNESENYFIIQGTIYNVSLLKAPYETNCLPDTWADFCEPNCNTKYQRKYLGRLPFHEMITEISDERMILQRDLRNQTIRNLIRRGAQECSEKCIHDPCDSYFTLTDAAGHFDPALGHRQLVLAAGVPRSNGLIVRTFPLMLLIDFLNNLAVSASMWLGISVLSLVIFPAKIFSFYSQKRKFKFLRRFGQKQRLERLHRQLKITPRSFCPCAYCQRN